MALPLMLTLLGLGGLGGAGIVYDSVPELEWEDSINNGKAIIQAYNNTRNRQK